MLFSLFFSCLFVFRCFFLFICFSLFFLVYLFFVVFSCLFVFRCFFLFICFSLFFSLFLLYLSHDHRASSEGTFHTLKTTWIFLLVTPKKSLTLEKWTVIRNADILLVFHPSFHTGNRMRVSTVVKLNEGHLIRQSIVSTCRYKIYVRHNVDTKQTVERINDLLSRGSPVKIRHENRRERHSWVGVT
jgi:hypothetical protein